MRALIFVYIIEEVAHAHAQNAPLEWFLSTPGLGVVPGLLSRICWLHIRYSIFMVFARIFKMPVQNSNSKVFLMSTLYVYCAQKGNLHRLCSRRRFVMKTFGY